MEVANTVITEVVNEVVDSVWHQVGYIWNYKTNIHDLNQQLQKLKAQEESMLHSVEDAKRNGEVIEDTVTIWLKAADDAIEAAEEILKHIDTANMTCCTSIKTRYQFSRKAKKETTPVLSQVQQERNLIHKISHSLDVQELEPVKNYVVLESRMEVLEEIVAALKTVDVVGVYGMGGVGKTTLVKQQVIARVKEEGIFKVVAIANVTHNWDLARIQHEIADWLGLKFENVVSAEVRAARLHARLVQEVKVLIVLDDLWEMIELEKIGIPLKSCKILMTCRDLNILLLMGVQRHFLLEVLPEIEAWKLFQKKAGQSENSELQSIAIQVARRCAGLPVLIVAVATSLRNKELFEWNDALEQLQKFDNKGINAQVYTALELSYKFLADDAKSLLILNAQNYGKIHIRDMVNYAMGLGLFYKCNSIRVVRNRVLKVVNDLKKSCLLLEGEDNEFVRMHDVVRSFVASIASKQHHVFIVAIHTKLEEWPEDTFEQCTAISLPPCQFPKFPDVLECPNLESFMIYRHDPMPKFPDSFFSRAKKLKVLDLTDVNLSPLPLSLGFLLNLQTLFLDRCVLDDISAIGQLKNLQVLSLHGSNIVQLPKEVGNLTRLRILDLGECQRLELIPPGILNSLTELEELLMLDSFAQWESEGNASLSELKTLSNLINLEIHIMDGMIMPEDLFHEKLERFKIFVGDLSGTRGISKSLKLKLNAGTELESIKVLLRRTEDLHLDDMKGVKNVLPELDGKGFHELKHLQVRSCDKMEFIVDRTATGDIMIFASLELLCLVNLKKLENICYGRFTMKNCFNKLKKLKVMNCSALKNLFSFSVFIGLIQLQELDVRKCELLKMIASYEAEDVKDETMKLPQLRQLTLEDLSQLASFCSPTEKECEEISSVDEVGNVFSKKTQFPNLTELRLSLLNVEKIWYKHGTELCPFEKLTTLTVHGCGNLTSLLTSSMAQSLGKLKKVELRNCKSMEEVITTEGNETEANIRLSQLKYLELNCLPKLRRFCSGNNAFDLPLLGQVIVRECPKMEYFVQGKSATPNLISVQISEDEDEWCWEGSLNATIQKLFIETNARKIEEH